MTSDLEALAGLAGIVDHYWDISGNRRETSDATRRALLAGMGYDTTSDEVVGLALRAEQARRAARRLPDYVVMDPAWDYYIRHLDAPEDWRVEFEDGGGIEGRADTSLHLPPLPMGRHRLVLGAETATILAAPPSLPLPQRGWGVTLPLYGLRTPETGGIGDFADLAEAARGVGRHGAAFLGVNPIHASFPADPSIRSPYTPSHRRRVNVAHLRVPGLHGMATGPLVEHAAELPAKLAALEAMWAASGEAGDFRAWRAAEGAALEDFAVYEALAERFGATWDGWPEAYRDPRAPAVAAFARANATRVSFHAWLQYEAERQLGEAADAAAEAGLRHGLYLDLAVGTHPHGAETWAEPGSFARDVSLGAPPDAFAEGGQTWMLAPFNPRALVASGFAPLAATLRKQLQFAGALRIDHILGFDRAFWVPTGTDAPGTYVRMPKEAMLAVARIEAARAGAVIVGEDLGNIPEGLQGDLQASHILGCRLAMFESARPGGREPQDYSEQALASWGTHDLPTWAGWRQGRDIDARLAIGHLDPAAAEAARAARRADLVAFAGLAGGDGLDEMHRFVGRVASRLVALQIEDILGLADQANLPGTVEEYPNWRRRIPVAADGIGSSGGMARAAAIMRDCGR